MKMPKKLLALLLTLAMALSCVVSAGASTVPVSMMDGVGTVDPSTEGEAIINDTTDPNHTQQTQTKYASGTADGRARSEGPLPTDPIRLELPTVNANVLNMILDPHGLINKTGAARYGGAGAVSFANDTALYFLQSVSSGGEYTYGKSSQEMTVTNKSNLDVGLDVTLLVNKGDSEFDFAASEEDLKDAEGATMYLALQKDGSDFPVAAVASGDDVYEDLTISIGSGDTLEPFIDATTPAEAAYDSTVSGDKQYPKVAFQWAKTEAEDAEGNPVTVDVDNDTKEEFIGAFAGYTFALGYAANGGTRSIISGDAVTTLSGDAIQFDAGTVPTDYTVTANPAEIMDTANDVNVTVTFSKEGSDIGYAYFVVTAGAIGGASDGNSATFSFDALTSNTRDVDGQANFVDTIPMTDGAYVNGWNEDGGYIWAFVEDYMGDNATVTSGDELLASWGHDDATVPSGYASISFNLYGSINTPAEDAKTSVWDGQGHDITLDLIWDVFEIKGDVAGAEGGGDRVRGTAPKVVVTKASAGTGTTGANSRTLTLTWTKGDGGYADYKPSTSLVLSNGKTLAMTAATTATGGTLTSNTTTTQSMLGNSSVTGTITFTSASDSTKTYTTPAITGLRTN